MRGPRGERTGEPRGRARENAYARFLLVRSVEESDPVFQVLPAATRRHFSADGALAASASEGHEDAFLFERAERLSEVVVREHASLGSALRHCGLRVSLSAVIVVAGLLGLATDALGPSRHINLLAIPLLGILAWNFAVFVGLAVSTLFKSSRDYGGLAAGLSKRAFALWQWWASPRRAWAGSSRTEALRLESAVLASFATSWSRVAGSMLVARARKVLHLSAASFAGGVVAGMYLAGFAFSYQATWESTFLESGQVHALLRALLGPAALLLGTSLPSRADLELLQAPADGDAALWIHLWALTALLFVVAPRVLLALLALRRETSLQNGLTPSRSDPYVLRLLAPARGEGQRVEVLPYSYTPSARALSRLRERLLERLGNRIHLSVRAPLAYGAEVPVLASSLEGEELCVVCVFNLAQSPEQEVHGQLITDLREQGVARIEALLDTEAYQARLGQSGAAGEERLAERLRAWERVVREVELEPEVLSGEAA